MYNWKMQDGFPEQKKAFSSTSRNGSTMPFVSVKAFSLKKCKRFPWQDFFYHLCKNFYKYTKFVNFLTMAILLVNFLTRRLIVKYLTRAIVTLVNIYSKKCIIIESLLNISQRVLIVKILTRAFPPNFYAKECIKLRLLKKQQLKIVKK